jgi:hypothetical protein
MTITELGSESISDLIKTAIRNRLQVIAIADGHYREFCPHAIGWKRGIHHVMTYQFGGSSNSGLPLGGQWRCFDVAKLSNVRLRNGEWHTGLRHTRPQTCIDQIELEVAY